ncbi:hypothetical protein TRFO_03819 [Tritrichomonas foetus]|uniref:Phosphoprotein phosphatase n=1 Tax=Tritrichomonas foetus TaxID=1144522 RepID=A0A1J4KK72_9EUKA|nr:hypothetical protein TRFO_03819 [Tritrichomonas foetus]|eukprot:OHT11627.1 hypothetical protein TRFO_03819 [Tritrichomonas foetus]
MRKMIRPSKQNKKPKTIAAKKYKCASCTDSNIKKFFAGQSKPKSKSVPNSQSSSSTSFNYHIPAAYIKKDKIDNITTNKTQLFCAPRNLESSKLIEKTSPFDKCKPSEFPAAFTAKCRVCCGFCNFKDDRQDMKLKQIKHDTLQQLFYALTTPEISRHLTITCTNALFHMICVNIFRHISFIKFDAMIENAADKEWIHLDEIYNIFEYILTTKLINMTTIQMKTYIKQLFRIVLSPDVREQRAVCNCLSAFLKSYPDSKSYITMKAMLLIISSQEDPIYQQCLPSFLNFYVRNFSNLKPTNLQQFFRNYILPLSLSSLFPLFHSSYLDLVEVFLMRDPMMVNEYINYLIKHWPVANAQKQTSFLNAFHKVVHHFAQQISQKSTIQLYKVISNCFSDFTADVSQEALYMVQDENMATLLWDKGNEIASDVLDTLFNVANSHWIGATRTFAKESYDYLQKRKQNMPENLMKQTKTEIEIARNRNEMWTFIRNMAKNNYNRNNSCRNSRTSSNNSNNCSKQKNKLRDENNPNNFFIPQCPIKPPEQPRNRPFRTFKKNPHVSV